MGSARPGPLPSFPLLKLRALHSARALSIGLRGRCWRFLAISTDCFQKCSHIHIPGGCLPGTSSSCSPTAGLPGCFPRPSFCRLYPDFHPTPRHHRGLSHPTVRGPTEAPQRTLTGGRHRQCFLTKGVKVSLRLHRHNKLGARRARRRQWWPGGSLEG